MGGKHLWSIGTRSLKISNKTFTRGCSERQINRIVSIAEAVTVICQTNFLKVDFRETIFAELLTSAVIYFYLFYFFATEQSNVRCFIILVRTH